MFYVTPNDYARQARRIRELTATVTDLLLRQGRLLDRIHELTEQVNEADLRALDRICELTDQVNDADLRAEAAEARVRELEAAIKDIHSLATECPQPSKTVYTFTQDDVKNLLHLLDTLRDHASGRIDGDDLVLTNCYLHILDAMLTEDGADNGKDWWGTVPR